MYRLTPLDDRDERYVVGLRSGESVLVRRFDFGEEESGHSSPAAASGLGDCSQGRRGAWWAPGGKGKASERRKRRSEAMFSEAAERNGASERAAECSGLVKSVKRGRMAASVTAAWLTPGPLALAFVLHVVGG